MEQEPQPYDFKDLQNFCKSEAFYKLSEESQIVARTFGSRGTDLFRESRGRSLNPDEYIAAVVELNTAVRAWLPTQE